MTTSTFNHNQAFLKTDGELLAKFRAEDCDAGSTGTCVVKLGPILYCANTGDSRSILCRCRRLGGGDWAVEAIALSEDQKPSREDEKARIKLRGGMVQKGRLMGSLAVSRAFGDASNKKSIKEHMMEGGDDDEDLDDLPPEHDMLLLIADPEIKTHDLTGDTSDALFLLLACDGDS
jgi:serine/threonine protein phosphatase PrpC